MVWIHQELFIWQLRSNPQQPKPSHKSHNASDKFPTMHHFETEMCTQTPRKLLGFYRTEDRFWPDFADIKHDYTQEFYRSYSSFISQCPRTGKFRGVCAHMCTFLFKMVHCEILDWCIVGFLQQIYLFIFMAYTGTSHPFECPFCFCLFINLILPNLFVYIHQIYFSHVWCLSVNTVASPYPPVLPATSMNK